MPVLPFLPPSVFKVVGIITRHDLTHENLREKYREKKRIVKEQRRKATNISNPFALFSRS